MQAPDGQKGHEPQFWAVLRFERTIGGPGTLPGLFQGPNDIDVLPCGGVCVSDRSNHRLQVLAPPVGRAPPGPPSTPHQGSVARMLLDWSHAVFQPAAR